MQKIKQLKNIGYVLLCFSGFSLADSVTVYRWVDDNNVVHFSQNQPSHNNYTELTMSNTVKPKNDLVAEQPNEPLEEPLELQPSTEKCEEAKANVRTLKAYDKIQFTDPQGVIQVLSEKEKLQQLEINEKLVEVYCG